MSGFISNDRESISWHLSLRVERPIEGCELSPHPFLRIKGGSLDNSSRQKLLDTTAHYFVYRWYRGPRRQICANESCPRSETFHPIHWSRFSLGGPGLQCTVCDKAGVPRHLTLFCSTSCFKIAWKEHSVKHLTLHQKSRKKSLDEDVDVIEQEEVAGDGGGFIEGLKVHDVLELNEGEEWKTIYDDKTYMPRIEDVGCSLKIECSVLSATGELMTVPVVVYTEPVLALPSVSPKRTLIAAPNSGTTSGTRIRVLTYNILAEIFATRQVYPYCDIWSLSWPYRRHLLLQEIEEAQADIICLQEVQTDYFETDILPALSALGYEGIFKQKTRESMGSYGKVDGCATFWRISKLTMVENYAIEFNDCARQQASQQGQDDAEVSRLIHRLSKDNVAQILVLDTSGRGNRTRGGQHNNSLLCVVNTHLYSNPKLSDVKLWQTLTLMQEVESFIAHRELATVVCGDFNSEPDSAVYQLLSRGVVEPNDTDAMSLVHSWLVADPDQIAHNIELVSAMVAATGSEPHFTNYTVGFKGTLDYLWFTPARLRVLAVTALPEEEEIRTSGEALPSAERPSDHLMLCSDFSLVASGPTSVLRSQTSQRMSMNAPTTKSRAMGRQVSR